MHDGMLNGILNLQMISEGSTNLYYTDTRVDARVNTLLQAGPGINIVPSPIPGQPMIN